jgi:hypothetical protein
LNLHPKDQAMQDALDGIQGSGPEADAWKAVRSDLEALRQSAPECQVTFEHLEGRLYRETVKTSAFRSWVPTLALGACVLGGAFFVGHRFGQASSRQAAVVAFNPSGTSASGQGLRDDEDPFGAEPSGPFSMAVPEASPAAQEPAAVKKPVDAPRPAARESAPGRTLQPQAPVRRRPVAQAASLPVEAPSAPSAGPATPAGPSLAAARVGGDGGPDEAADAGLGGQLTAIESEGEAAVVVDPAAPMGRSGAPIAIENPVMGDIIFGG